MGTSARTRQVLTGDLFSTGKETEATEQKKRNELLLWASDSTQRDTP